MFSSHASAEAGRAAPEAAPEPLPTVPGYAVLGRLGQGGMGTVYLAQDEALGRRVAVKVNLEDFSGEAGERARRRFLREAQSMAQLDHLNLVRVYRVGELGDGRYLVMELIEGETLAGRLERLGRLGVEEALGLLAQAVAGLRAAWEEKRIIHRDLKPSNLLIDAAGTAKVADFGLARPATTERSLQVTQSGEVFGSPHYMAPERLRGDTDDFRGDIYSLGVVLFEMLAGRPPFTADTPVGIAAQALMQPLPDLRQARPEVPEGVVQLVKKMTDKEPERRHASYEELAGELRALLRGEDTGAATAVRAAERAGVGRRRLAVGLLGLALVGVVSVTWLAVRAGRDEERAAVPTPAVTAPETRSAATAVVPPPQVPAPFATAAGSTAGALARELGRFHTGVFAVELGAAGAGVQRPLQVRVRVDRPAFPLILFLDGAGDLHRLYPFGLDAGEPLAAGREAVLPPAGAADSGFVPTAAGWLVVVVSSTPLPQRLVLGARPGPGGLVTLYPNIVHGRDDVFPAHAYLSWLTGELRNRAGGWDLRTVDWRG